MRTNKCWCSLGVRCGSGRSSSCSISVNTEEREKALSSTLKTRYISKIATIAFLNELVVHFRAGKQAAILPLAIDLNDKDQSELNA
jgi:hypothetical protein